jgi:hypothetical protein
MEFKLGRMVVKREGGKGKGGNEKGGKRKVREVNGRELKKLGGIERAKRERNRGSTLSIGAKGYRVAYRGRQSGDGKERMRGWTYRERIVGRGGEGKCRLRQVEGNRKGRGEMMGKGREGLEETEEER